MTCTTVRTYPALADRPRTRWLLLHGPDSRLLRDGRTRRQPEHAVLGARCRRHHQHDQRHDRWKRALYGGGLLPPQQRAELESLISTTTGQRIERTSWTDPSGFGLGVRRGTSEEFGTVGFFSGGTFGFTSLHFYFPDFGLIMAMALNSAAADTQLLARAESVYDTLLSHGVISPRPVAATSGA